MQLHTSSYPFPSLSLPLASISASSVAQLADHRSATFNPVVTRAAINRCFRLLRSGITGTSSAIRTVFRHRCLYHRDEISRMTCGKQGAVTGRRAIQRAPVVSLSGGDFLTMELLLIADRINWLLLVYAESTSLYSYIL